MKRYDSSTDRVFNCTVVYRTPAGRLVQAHLKTIAPTMMQALELAVKLVRADRRRVIGTIKYGKVYAA